MSGFVNLRKLSLDYTQFSDASVSTLRYMPRLEAVSLRYTNISDRGAEHLAALPSLRTAYLTGTKISDDAVPNLSQLSSLDELYIRWTGITNNGADKLAAALPDCDVFHHALTLQPEPAQSPIALQRALRREPPQRAQ
jgi:Leucine-rich repeat (LRR) protein